MAEKLIIGTTLSILIFCSISFLTILVQLNSPLNHIDRGFQISIGFPLRYYHEFVVDCSVSNWGWEVKNLLLDCGLTWGTTMLFVILRKNKHQ